MSNPNNQRSQPIKHSSQTGAFAVEFALIFVLFFFILFVLLNVGMMFAAQQSINYASQEAARSLAIYQNAEQETNTCIADGKTFGDDTKASNEQRAQRAYTCALEQSLWIENLAKGMNNTTAPIVEIAVCQRSGAVITPRGNANCASYIDQLALNEVAIIVQYDYSKFPMIPSLGVLDIYKFFTEKITLSNTQVIRTQTLWSAQDAFLALNQTEATHLDTKGRA